MACAASWPASRHRRPWPAARPGKEPCSFASRLFLATKGVLGERQTGTLAAEAIAFPHAIGSHGRRRHGEPAAVELPAGLAVDQNGIGPAPVRRVDHDKAW